MRLSLVVADADSQPDGRSRDAAFSFTVVNQKDETPSVNGEQSDTRTFDANARGWGFDQLLPISRIADRSQGFIVNDTLIIKCTVKVPTMDLAPPLPAPRTDASQWLLYADGGYQVGRCRLKRFEPSAESAWIQRLKLS
jgi:hypothetical protein